METTESRPSLVTATFGTQTPPSTLFAFTELQLSSISRTPPPSGPRTESSEKSPRQFSKLMLRLGSSRLKRVTKAMLKRWAMNTGVQDVGTSPKETRAFHKLHVDFLLKGGTPTDFCKRVKQFCCRNKVHTGIFKEAWADVRNCLNFDMHKKLFTLKKTATEVSSFENLQLEELEGENEWATEGTGVCEALDFLWPKELDVAFSP